MAPAGTLVKNRDSEMSFSDFANDAVFELCPVCAGDEIRVLCPALSFVYSDHGRQASWHFDLLECRECGLTWVYPTPCEDTLFRAYDETYHCYVPPLRDAIGTLKGYLARFRYAGFLNKDWRPTSYGQRVVASALEIITGKTVSYSLGIPLLFHKTASPLRLQQRPYSGWSIFATDMGIRGNAFLASLLLIVATT